MNYLYEALEKPARLYIKQCPHCGKKYFGKSIRNDIENYTGSGLYWKRHLKKHKVNPIHLWNSDWYYDTSISRFATKFSGINRISESSNWANMKPENGRDGGFSDSDRELAKNSQSKEEKHIQSSKNGKKVKEMKIGIFNEEHLSKRREYGRRGGLGNTGKAKTEKHKEKLSKSLMGRKYPEGHTYPKNRKPRITTEETKEKLRMKARERWARERQQ
jgi:hypothetical protein